MLNVIKKSSKVKFGWLNIGLVAVTVSLFAVFVVAKSFYENQCANTLSCKESLEFDVNNDVSAVFNNQKVDVPAIDLGKDKVQTRVLGESDVEGEKHIYVDLDTQTLTAYQGQTMFMQALVSTGKWGKTPVGEFTIWEKVRSTKMSGGSGADYYYLPNVPFVMFFSNAEVAAGRGFGLHGAYWHNNFGHVMSHGCVNMRTIDAEKLFYWANPDSGDKNLVLSGTDNPGTKITIYHSQQN